VELAVVGFEAEGLEVADSVEGVFEVALQVFVWGVLDQVGSLLEELGQVE
jgi:hypothetical protein